MKLEDNSIIQSLEKENTDVKQGAVIYLLTESLSILHHIYEMDDKDEECKLLTQDLAELFISAKAYCKTHNIDWNICKEKIINNNQNKEIKVFMNALNL